MGCKCTHEMPMDRDTQQSLVRLIAMSYTTRCPYISTLRLASLGRASATTRSSSRASTNHSSCCSSSSYDPAERCCRLPRSKADLCLQTTNQSCVSQSEEAHKLLYQEVHNYFFYRDKAPTSRPTARHDHDKPEDSDLGYGRD
jgi:hypothetical protein